MARKKVFKRAKQPQRSKPIIRVGTKYQANIPTEVNEDERSDLFRFGIPIPVTWVCHDMKTVKENPNKSSISSDTETRKDDNLFSDVEEMNLECKDKGLLPVPGSYREPWSALEHGAFLLSLYIFGRNFGIVKEFMGKNSDKGMGSLLSYFYGTFYNSQDFKRWDKWKNDRRRPLYAGKILIGRQNDELLSRLFANVMQEQRDTLATLGKNYLLERLSLEEFMFTLRDIVGINRLVEAIAIGQEERDLLQFPPTCDSYVVIQELPTWNPFSSVTNQEIIDILKEDVRLSEEKTRHIFSELVWPRLVSKGWRRCQNAKNLVYFVPDKVDFSSKELKEGIHYFDSIADVLSKVASEPQILENESDQEKPLDLDMNQDSDNEEQHDLNMMELSNSLVSKPANETGQGYEELMNLDLTHYTDNEERNGYTQPNFGNDHGLERLTILDTSLDQTPLGNDKEKCLKMVAESDSGDSSFPRELRTDQQRFSTRDRTATTKLLEAFAHGYLAPKRKRKDGQKMPSRRVHGKTDPEESGCSGDAEKVVEDSSQ